MTDEHARRLDDIEKRLEESSLYALTTAVATTQRKLSELEERVRRLEMAAGKEFWKRIDAAPVVETSPNVFKSGWCACGRDVCRAPNCFSHKPDPLGR